MTVAPKDFSGFQETGFLHFDCHWEFKTGDEIHTGVNFKKDGNTMSVLIDTNGNIVETETDIKSPAADTVLRCHPEDQLQ